MRNPVFGFDDLLALAPEPLRPLCESLRALIGALHSGAVETVWPRLKIASYGLGPKKMSEHYAFIAVQRSHVNLGFYRGATLPDPQRRLEGTGRQLRHVKLGSVADTRAEAVAALLRAAIAERRAALAGR